MDTIKYCFFILFLFLVKSKGGFAQSNLVPNPSFENMLSCPDSLNQVSKSIGWMPIRSSPDYFNVCSVQSTNPVTGISIPLNYWGYQFPSSGAAYIGLIAKSGSSNVREYVGGELSMPLLIGKKYFVSFKVCLALNNFPYLCAVNKLGILFSNQSYSINNPAPICNYAQIYSDSIIKDTLNWVTICGSFIADSNYSFINIGNFFDDLHTDSIQILGTFSRAYYYIDDICVSDDSSICFIINSMESINKNNKLTVIPNPFLKSFIIQNVHNDIQSIELFDGSGKPLSFETEKLSGKIKITPKNLNIGFCFLRIEINNFIFYSKIFHLNYD